MWGQASQINLVSGMNYPSQPRSIPDSHLSDPLTYWWGVTLCPPELNDVALAETVVILMRIAAMREMRLNEEVNKPSLADVLEFRGHKMDCSVESTPHEEACIYSSASDGGELLKQFGEPAQMPEKEEVTTRSHGEFAATSNPWQRREEQEAKEVAEMQKRNPGLARRQGNRWDQYGESSSASPSETHGRVTIVLLRSLRGAHGKQLLSRSVQPSLTGFKRPTEGKACGPDGLVTPDSHSRTSGVIVLQSGCRLPAMIVHGSRHQNGKGRNGPPRLSGT